jgi:glycosyltransferase involved in cell wall biosynthesis
VKVALVTELIRPGGGPGGYLFNLREGMRSNGVLSDNIDFLSFSESAQRTAFVGGNGTASIPKRALKRMMFDLPSAVNHLKWMQRITPKALTEKVSAYDHVILHGQTTYCIARHLHKIGVPFSVMLHSPTILADEGMMGVSPMRKATSLYYAWLRHIDRFLLKKSRFVFSPSENAMDRYYEQFPELDIRTKTLYVRSGAPAPVIRSAREEVRQSLGFAESDLVIFYGGRFVEDKGFDLFLRVAEKLSAKNKSFKFACAGAGPMETNIPGVVQNLGWRSDIHDLVNAVDLVVIPNRSTYFDLLPLEVAAVGRCIVSTLTGGNRQLKDLMPDLFLAERADEAALVRAVETAAQHVKQAGAQSAANIKAYRENFTTGEMARSWCERIESME